MKMLVAYDGTVHAKKALRYSLAKAKEAHGEVVLVQVFDRSAFIDYDAGPRAEELARAEAASALNDAKRIAAERSDVPFSAFSADGDALATIDTYAHRMDAGLVIVPPRYSAGARHLGRPVSVIPGVIIVPVDMTGVSERNLEVVRREALATGSEVVLLGIVPEHLYSRGERTELNAVERETTERMTLAERELAKGGIAVRSLLRFGYPDVEVIKAAKELPVTMVLLAVPAAGERPSELSKTAAILTDEPERLTVPVVLAPSQAAG